jgi:TetR/AcrR family transcriptional repressor of nem operon
MRISKEQARENHERVVDTASELFRAHGFDGVGVADVMKAAGFTHGGFYNHFESKEVLSAEATRRAFTGMAAERERAHDVAELLTRYLSRSGRKALAKGCPAAALGADAARQSDRVKTAFAQGVEGMITSLMRRLEAEGAKDDVRRRAINLVAKMVGALMLSRGIPDGDPLAQEILSASLDGCLAEAESSKGRTRRR